MRLFYFNITYRCNSRCIFCAADHPLLMDSREMSLDEFCDILDRNQVGTGDRVVVNGGEPTVHKDFFAFLNAIKSRGAYIDLFTNGMRLAEPEFLDDLLKYSPMYIRIPLFGASAAVHDKYTNCPGSFDKVVSAIDRLVSVMDKKVFLEIKMLLSKGTVNQNEQIFEICRERWTHPQTLVSLNPLLISRCVIDQEDVFVDSYTNLMAQSEPLIHKIADSGWRLSIDLMPYCTFPNKELIALCYGEKILAETHYSDPAQDRSVDEYQGREKCTGCRYIQVCSGFPRSYLKYMGSAEVRPM